MNRSVSLARYVCFYVVISFHNTNTQISYSVPSFLNYFAMVVDKGKLLDTVEEEDPQRILMRTRLRRVRDHTIDEENRKKKKRRLFACLRS